MQYRGNVVYGIDRYYVENLIDQSPNKEELFNIIEEAFEDYTPGFLTYHTALEDETNYVFGVEIGSYSFYGISDVTYAANSVKDEEKAEYLNLIESVDNIELKEILKKLQPSVLFVCSGY